MKWFRHDFNAHNDPKIIEMIDTLGIESYGIFWVLIELLRDQEDYRLPIRSIPGISKRYGVEKEKVSKIVFDFCLFCVDIDDCFFSESLKKRMEEFEKKSLSAKISAEKRWNLSTKNANAMPTQCDRNANAMPTQCDRNAISINNNINIKDIKKDSFVKTDSLDEPTSTFNKKINYQAVIDSFHEICDTLPRIIKITDQRKVAIKARIAEYGYDDIKRAFEMVKSSEFLCNNAKWQASFDWIMSKSAMPKILEGNYADRNQVIEPTSKKTKGEAKLSCDNPYCRNGYRYISTKSGDMMRRCECWTDPQTDQIKNIPIISEEEKNYER